MHQDLPDHEEDDPGLLVAAPRWRMEEQQLFLDSSVGMGGSLPFDMHAPRDLGGLGVGLPGHNTPHLSPAGHNIYDTYGAAPYAAANMVMAPTLNNSPACGRGGLGQYQLAPPPQQVNAATPEEGRAPRQRMRRAVTAQVEGRKSAPPGRPSDDRERNMRWLRAVSDMHGCMHAHID